MQKLLFAIIFAALLNGCAQETPEQLAERKHQCTITMMSSIGRDRSYSESSEYKDKVKKACAGLSINGINIQ